LILTAHAVTYAYHRGSPPAINGVDLQVNRGEVLAVVGPNGSGKSTLMAVLAGWLQPQQGRVELAERPLQQWPARQRARHLAYLPQQVAPLYDLTVNELVATGRYPQQTGWTGQDATDRAAVEQALAATDTAGLATRSYSTLSGGERQRVLVASVLAQEPEVLLLDEPTGSLDLHHRVQVFRLLRNAAVAGRGVAVVTHDLNLAALFADRVVLLVAGQVALVGPPDEVLGQQTLEQAYGAELVVLPHPDGVHMAVLPARGDEP
jgi:iron complex transport system ATP-binding protein